MEDHVKACCAAANACGETTAAKALADGASAGIPWQDLLKGFVTLALPVFLKWVQDWIAGNQQPLPDPNKPNMP